MKRLLGLVALVSLCGVLAPAAHAAEIVEAEGDWITVLLRAETDVQGVQLDILSDVTYPGRPGAIGMGLRSGEYGSIGVFDVADDLTVSVAGAPGGYLEVGVDEQEQSTSLGSSGTLFGGDQLDAGTDLELLLLFPGGVGSHVVRTSASSGTLGVEVRAGVGSQAFSVVSSTASGTGVSTYAATAGDVTVHRGPKSAIIGGLAPCTACVVDITHDGATATSSPQAPLPLFAGDAGTWAFHWQGLDAEEGASELLAAYVPVGEEIMNRWRVALPA